MPEVLLIVGLLAAIAGWLWILIGAFQNGDTRWGIGILIFGILGLVYGILHWAEMKVPTILIGVGIVLRLGGYLAK